MLRLVWLVCSRSFFLLVAGLPWGVLGVVGFSMLVYRGIFRSCIVLGGRRIGVVGRSGFDVTMQFGR